MKDKEMTEVNKFIGKLIRARRQLIGKSQSAIAEKIGITFQQLQKYEAGTNTLSIPRALDLCRVLGIRLADMEPASKTNEVAALPLALAKNLNKLSEEGRNSVMALVRSLAKEADNHD